MRFPILPALNCASERRLCFSAGCFQHSVTLVILLFCTFSLAARCAAQDTASTSATQTVPQADPQATFSTKIVAGTEIYVDVADSPEVSGSHTVGADGDITFSLADTDGNNKTEWTVNVKDKTPNEAKDAIEESLKTYYKMPVVRVIITKLPRLKVEVSGAVQKSGMLELEPGSLLSDALAKAIYKPNADLAKVRILRKAKEGEQPETIFVDFAAYQEGRSEIDPALQNGDRIVLIALPEEKVRPAPQFIRVVGEVFRDAYLPFANGMRVRSAIELAGGLKPSADRSKLRLVRGADGKILELNADKIDADDPVHNVFLAANDMLFVNVRDRSLIYAVMGEVMSPNTFPYPADKRVTLMEALVQAGGMTKTADKRKGILRRGFLRNPALSPEIPFDTEKILKGDQKNWELEAGDAIIILPRQKRPTFLQQALPLLFRFLPFGI
jgi:protein involved in polysaccharide export with SLBB domain